MTTLQKIIDSIIAFINSTLVPLLFALAFIVFLYGIYKYFILGGANEEKRREGSNYMITALVGFFIMVSVWGLVNLVVGSIGFDSKTAPCIPTLTSDCASGVTTGSPTSP